MTISETANKNHEELFPNHKSTLKVTDPELIEVLIPYVGMSKVYEFIHATNEILEKRGIKLPLEGQSTTSPETRFEKGREVQKIIFGEMIDKMYAESPAKIFIKSLYFSCLY
jgi:hypothetical protein